MKKLLFALPLLALFVMGIPAAQTQAAGLAAPAFKPAVVSDVVKVRRRGFRRFRRRSIIIRIYPRRHRFRYRYTNSCGWLRRKARRTGHRYWWRRYNRCRWG